MLQLYPMLFLPNLHSAIWGGRKLTTWKGMVIDDAPIGESWEVSALPSGMSIVANGSFAGRSLSDVVNEFPQEILGEHVAKQYDKQLPLLVKFIDAEKDLSIQVHPDDAMALREHGKMGKTEMWYVIDAKPGAKLVYGLKKSCTIDMLKNAIENMAGLKVLNVNIKTIYYKNDPDHAMRADKEELKNISKRVKEDYDELVNSSTFQFCDNALKQLILEINIPEEINILYQTLLSAELLSKNEGSTIMKTYSEEIIYDIQERLKKLDNLLATNCNFDYSITEDINDIKQRDMLDLIALQTVAENFGYFSELPQSYKDSLK